MNILLKEHGLKETKQRKKIIEVIDKLQDNSTITNIINNCKNDMNVSTIYRVIDSLLENNIIETNLNYNNELYYSKKEEHGHYFTCIKCHKREKINDCPLEKTDKYLEENKGYTILNHIVQIEGICKKCKRDKQ